VGLPVGTTVVGSGKEKLICPLTTGMFGWM